MNNSTKGNYVECPYCKAKHKGAIKGPKETPGVSVNKCPKCMGATVHISTIDSALVLE